MDKNASQIIVKSMADELSKIARFAGMGGVGPMMYGGGGAGGGMGYKKGGVVTSKSKKSLGPKIRVVTSKSKKGY